MWLQWLYSSVETIIIYEDSLHEYSKDITNHHRLFKCIIISTDVKAKKQLMIDLPWAEASDLYYIWVISLGDCLWYISYDAIIVVHSDTC